MHFRIRITFLHAYFDAQMHTFYQLTLRIIAFIFGFTRMLEYAFVHHIRNEIFLL